MIFPSLLQAELHQPVSAVCSHLQQSAGFGVDASQLFKCFLAGQVPNKSLFISVLKCEQTSDSLLNEDFCVLFKPERMLYD